MRTSFRAASQLCCCIPVLLAGPPNATAETAPIVITASRLDAAASVPASVTVIDADDIRNSPARTLPELLSLEAGVVSRSLFGNSAARAVIDVRGFGATATQNTLILLDGRRLNDIDLSAIDFAAIPLDNVERIEVIRGGGGVLYGDGAVGGTINIITRAPSGRGFAGQVEAEVGSYQSRRLAATVSRGDGGVAYTLHASGIETDGYRDNNELSQRVLQADLRRPWADGEWFLKLGADDQELGLPGERFVDPGAGLDELKRDRRGTGNPDDYAEQAGRHVTGGLSRYLEDGGELVIDLGYRHKDQQAFFEDYEGYLPFYPPGTFARYQDSSLDTWSFTPRLTRNLGESGTMLTTGIDLYYSVYDSERSQRPETAAIHRLDVRQATAAAYASALMPLNETTSITAGARLQRVRLNARDHYDPTAAGQPYGGNQADELNQSDTEPMLELGLRHELAGGVSLFAKAGRSVRLGTIDEIFETDPDTFALMFSPLEPQTANHFDIGGEITAGGAKALITAYYMNLRNEIHFDSASFTNINLDPTRRYGLEASLKTRLSQSIRTKAAYTYTVARFREGPYAGNEIPLVPRHAASLGLFWDIQPRTTLSASANYVGEKRLDNDQANIAEEIPGYTLVDLQLRMRRGDWDITTRANNLFDRQVFATGIASTFTPGRFAAYPLPERTLSLAVSRQF